MSRAFGVEQVLLGLEHVGNVGEAGSVRRLNLLHSFTLKRQELFADALRRSFDHSRNSRPMYPPNVS